MDRGIIKRIYLENFVTYDKVSIKPGRNLNLLIGPNGTGKSTIVCAIVLGLCGKPKLLGRGSTVGAYVKTGCEDAKIEIELKDADNKSIVIVRNFKRNNETTWMLNGKRAHHEEIVAIIKELNIQVDNLCQFLPQDKVQSFSEMNSQELLENTERSVGDPKLLDYHNKLKELRKVERDYTTTMANKSRLLKSETKKYEGMKEMVGSIKERRAIDKKIETLEQKRAWITYDLSRKQLGEVKVDRDKAAADMKKLDERLRPIDKKIGRLESHIAKLKKTLDSHDTKLSGKMSVANSFIEDVHNMEIREIEKNREHKIQSEKNRYQEINDVVQQKNKLDNDLKVIVDDVGTAEALIDTYRRVGHELDQKRRAVDKLTAEINASRAQEEAINDQIKGWKREIQVATDVDAKRFELLRRFSPDAHKGVLWLRQNRDKFTSMVHEPMLLNIHVKDARYTKYFENIFGLRDLLAFVCEDKSDMNRLMGYLRDELKLTINVVHSDPEKNVQITPYIPIDNIRQFGFQHYLINLVEAPETIMKFLISMYNITNIPIGTRSVEDNIEQIPTGLRQFFSQDNYYAVSISKYTKARSTCVSRVSGNGSLSIILDTEKLRGLESKLEQLTASKERIAEDIKAEDAKLRQANAELDELRSSKQSAQRNAQTIQSLNSRISIAVKKIKELQNETTSIEDIKAAATQDIQKTLRSQLQVYAKYNAQLSDCSQSITDNAQMKFELDLLKRVYASQVNESQHLRDQCALAEQTFKRLESELAPLRKATVKLYDKAMLSTGQVNPQDPKFRTFNLAFAKLPVTLDEVEAAHQAAQAKLYCLVDNADGEAILRNYKKVEATVQRLTEEIDRMICERGSVEEKINELRPLWLTPLQELVDRINKNFSTYFGLMNCAGEVTLNEGESQNDFDQYGLKIRVKFRDADELQELTRQRQSGGERAVTTAVYMIALQELSRVPFRCVDEINQGMDATNERRVFELIVQITKRSNSSQYFLVTPKLLPDLEYGENVTVHCVYNGLYMVPSDAFDTTTYCEKLRKALQ